MPNVQIARYAGKLNNRLFGDNFMNRIYYIIFLLVFFSMSMLECRKPYDPPIIKSGKNYLVVECAINTGQDSTTLRLSHTVPISSPAGIGPTPVSDASATIESDAGATYPLNNIGDGYYSTGALNLSPIHKYRLKITAGGKDYQSDLVTAKNSQPIDNVNYKFTNTGIQINVNTHDPSNNSRYYRWDYEETWIIHSKYQSFEMLQATPADTVVPRPLDQQIYTCWLNQHSSSIVLASTAKLTQDIINDAHVTFISSNSEMLTERYSILVRQYTLTKEAYGYFDQLRKNTEGMGTIFDPQPTNLSGNIHCVTDPSEQVIGYVTAGSVTQKRIYINKEQLPGGDGWSPDTPYGNCLMDTALYISKRIQGQNDVKAYIYPGYEIPIIPIAPPGSPILGFTASSPSCVDCTLRGTNKQPAFWVN
jgi:hypothetical protein